MDSTKISDINSFNNTLSLLTEPLYTMTIELNQGKSSKIKIYPNSHPEQLAFDFCKTNNLDYSAMNYLTENIKLLLDSFKHSLTEHNNNNPQNNHINQTKSLSSQNIFKKVNNEDTNIIYNTITDIPYNTDTSLLNNSKKTFSTINKSSLTNEPHTLFSYESFFKNKLHSKQTNTNNNTTTTDNNNSKDKPKSKHVSSNNYKSKQNNNNKSSLTNNYFTRQTSPDDNNEQQLLQSLLLSKTHSKHNTNKTSPTKTSSNDNACIINTNHHNGNNTSNYNRNDANNYLLTEPYYTNISKLKLDLSMKNKPTSTYQPLLHKTNKHHSKHNTHLNYTTTDNNNYTFKPSLNKHSIAIIKKRPHLQSSFLTHQHNIPNLKRIETEMYKNCSFIPKCTKYPGCDSLLPFYERQKIYNSRSQEKIKKILTQTNDHIDHKTGQEYFKP